MRIVNKIKSIFIIMFALSSLGGCVDRHAHNQVAIEKIRSGWVAGWIVDSDDERLKNAYVNYKSNEQAFRSSWFGTVTALISLDLEKRPLYGAQMIDILGNPDSWRETASGNTVFLYFFKQANPDQNEVCLITVNQIGRVTKIGFNDSTSIDRKLLQN